MSKERILFIMGLLLVLMYYIPFVYLGDNSYITIHDNLDSSIANLNVLKENGMLFHNDVFPAMSGLTGANISFGFLPRLLLIQYLDPFHSYMVNELIGRLIGFIGMYFFLKRYMLKSDGSSNIVAVITALCFALMSYYSDYGLSVMGQPLLVYSFFNLRERRQVMLSYLFILFIALYSSLVLSGLFVGIALFSYYFYIKSKDKNVHKEYIIGFLIWVLTYMITNYSLLASFFMSVPSHRLEFYFSSSVTDICRDCWGMLMITQYHTGSLPVMLILLYAILLSCYERKIDKQIKVLLGMILGVIMFGCIYKGMLLLFPSSSLLNAFQFDRFYFLLPFLWMCLLANLFEKLLCYRRNGMKLLFLSFFLFLGGIFLLNSEYRGIVKSMLHKETAEQPSYKQFYATDLFDEIDTDLSIRKNKEHIVCLGLYPSVALYNGYYTLDGYFQTYPLSYKHQFREVIAPELAKSKELKDYFDNWGSRCYLFSSELGRDYLWGKNRNGVVKNLEIDTKQLKEMGCTYLFSAVDIENSQSLNLDIVGLYTTPSSYWNIRVYKIRS